MYIGSSGGKGRGTCIRTRDALHLMTRADEFLNDCGADEASSPGDKDTHSPFSLCWPGQFRTSSGIANEFSKWRRRRSLGRAPMPAWTTSRNRQVLERELCIA